MAKGWRWVKHINSHERFVHDSIDSLGYDWSRVADPHVQPRRRGAQLREDDVRAQLREPGVVMGQDVVAVVREAVRAERVVGQQRLAGEVVLAVLVVGVGASRVTPPIGERPRAAAVELRVGRAVRRVGRDAAPVVRRSCGVRRLRLGFRRDQKRAALSGALGQPASRADAASGGSRPG